MGYGHLDKSTNAMNKRRWRSQRSSRLIKIVAALVFVNLFVFGSVFFISREMPNKAVAAPATPKIIYEDNSFYDISGDGKVLTVTFIDNMVDGYHWMYGMDLSDRIHQLHGFEAETTGIEIPESDNQKWVACFVADEKMIGPVELVFVYQNESGSDILVSKHLKMNITADYKIQVVEE